MPTSDLRPRESRSQARIVEESVERSAGAARSGYREMGLRTAGRQGRRGAAPAAIDAQDLQR